MKYYYQQNCNRCGSTLAAQIPDKDWICEQCLNSLEQKRKMGKMDAWVHIPGYAEGFEPTIYTLAGKQDLIDLLLPAIPDLKSILIRFDSRTRYSILYTTKTCDQELIWGYCDCAPDWCRWRVVI